MSGFSGRGELLYPSLFSPNFLHNIAGWSINQDGSAEFDDLFIGHVQCIAPNVNDGTGVANNDAIEACQALGCIPVLLPGIWSLQRPINLTQVNQQLLGSGPGTVLTEGSSWAGSALVMPTHSARISNLGFATEVAHFVDFANNSIFGFELDHIIGTAGATPGDVTAPDIITGVNLHRARFHDMTLAQNNPNKSILTLSSANDGNGGLSTFTWDNSLLFVGVGTTGSRTAPAIKVFASANKVIDAIRFENLFCNNGINGNNIDNTQYFFDIACTNGNAGKDADRIEFDHVTGNQVLGGLIRVQSAWGISLEHVSVGNVADQQGIPLGNSILRFATSNNGQPCGAIRIVNYQRESNATLTSSPPPTNSDISFSNDINQVYIESPSVADGNALQIYNGSSPGASGVQIMNPPASYNLINRASDTIEIGNGAIKIGGTAITVP